MAAFAVSQIRQVQHRKQTPSLPTLMLEFKPDSPTEKQRKRRSSRTSGLVSKDPWANTLLFRDAPDERQSIHDWNTRIRPSILSSSKEALVEGVGIAVTSDTTHSVTSFINPFAPRETRTASNSVSRPEYQRGPSNPSMNTYPHAPRERPAALISPSPSLRSRRSDLSSQASSQHPQVGFASANPQSYATLPSDLPSPASTSGYDAQFVEGWTAAQGRTSALSSHTRGSNSIVSVVPTFGSTPPGPRETIMDRAFQMRYIPGSERLQGKDDEKISSIARFEALMREVDERKRQKAISAQDGANVSSWDLDEESEVSSAEPDEEDEDDEDDEDDEGLNMAGNDLPTRTPAQRALDYISGRTTPLSSARPLSPPVPSNPPIPFLNSRAASDFHRPQTGTNPNPSRHTNARVLASRSISSTAIPGLQESSSTGLGADRDRDSQEKRRSGASSKRLSFQEFAKRLSSTSSLLLVQTNASSSSGRDGSCRDSSEFGGADDEKLHRRQTSSSVRSAATMPPPASDRDPRDKRRACRGSVGVFGSEGGFL